MGTSDAVRFQSVMGHDFMAAGPRKVAWLGSTASEAYDLFRHGPAREQLRDAGRIVVPGALAHVRGVPHVLMVWMRDDGTLAYDLRSYGDLFPEDIRFLFTRALRK